MGAVAFLFGDEALKRISVLPNLDIARCEHCGLCVEVCPHHAVVLGDAGPQFLCPESCVESGIYGQSAVYCLSEEVCPNDVIAWPFEIILGDLRDQ
jgi:ferredoxin